MMDENEKEVIMQNKVNYITHFFWAVCVLFCMLFLVWAYYGKLDVVSTADGRVIPSSKIKTIEHLEGGIVSEILVKEGDVVTADQSLMILEGIKSVSSVDELQVRITALRVDIVRLEAINDGKEDLEFPDDLVKMNPDLISEATSLFAVQQKRFKSELFSQNELIKQREKEIDAIDARIKNNTYSLELLEKQVEISKNLLKENLTTEYKHLSFLREESALKSKIEEDKTELERAHSVLDEARERLKQITTSMRQKAQEDLKDARQELDEFSQRLIKYADTLKKTVIRSPVDGIIKTLYVVTIGGVVSPGKPIIDIVPSGDRLVIEAQLPIQDIGYVQVEQPALITLASRDARRYGKLHGTVAALSPDTISNSSGHTFYAIRIKPEKDYFERGDRKYYLIPGMSVLAYIHTGNRTVLEYLLDPFIYSMDQALKER